MEERSDKELIELTKAGDNDAFGVLVLRYLKPLFNFVVRLSLSSSVAEDVVQETFVKAWKKIGRFDTRKNFKPWLYTIARNTFLDAVKKKKEIPISSFDTEEGNYIEDTSADDSIDVFEAFDQKKMSEHLKAAIETLPAMYQTVLSLHLEEGMTFQEIGDILGESIDTIKSRYRRACTKIRKLIV